MLYIVSPADVFLMETNGTVVYDDAVIVDLDWEELEQLQWHISGIADVNPVKTAREQTLARLASRQ